MRKFFWSCAGILLLTHAAAQSTFPEEGITEKDAVYRLYRNAVIHVKPGKTLDGDLLVRKGKIVSVGTIDEESMPENKVVENLNGAHIFPSFIELNSDYGLKKAKKAKDPPGPDQERTSNTGTYWNESFHPETNAALEFVPSVESSESYLKMGYGMALIHRPDGICRGTSSLVRLGEGEANELIVEPLAAMHFSFDKGSAVQDYPSSLMGSIALIRQALYDAQWYEKSKKEEINLSIEALNRNSSIPWFFEVEEANDLLRVQRIAEEFGLKVTAVGEGSTYQVAEELSTSIDFIVVPLDLPAPFDMSDPELGRLVSQRDMLHWERAPFNPRVVSSQKAMALSAKGIKKSEDFFENVGVVIESGLDPDSAFAALTVNPARHLGLEGIGKLDPGFEANFFITDKDPFRESDAQVLLHCIKGAAVYRRNPEIERFEGDYDLNVNDTYFELTLKGKKLKKAEIQFIAQDDTLRSKADFSNQGNQVVLSFSDPRGEGLYRLSATVLADNRIWDGLGIDPSGNYVKWSAIRRKTKGQPESSNDSLKVDSIPPIPHLYRPLSAYGNDSLPEEETVLIENATIWTCDSSGVIRGGSVLISKGKILAVGKSIKLSDFLSDPAVEVIDGTGKHVTPGIIDEHSHIAITRGVNEGTQSNTAEVRISDSVNPHDINIYRQLAGGVTTAQLLHGSANPIGGQSAIVKMRWGMGFNDLLFDRAPGFIKFALGENVKQSNWGDEYNDRYPQTRMGVEQFMYNEFFRAREYGQVKKIKKEGKTTRRGKKKTTESFRRDLELEALNEVLLSERFVTCHSYVQSEINMLMHLADSLGFTLNTFTHILEGYKVADKMKTHGAAASTFSDWWAYKYEVKDAIPHNASLLHRMGVVTAINSDDAEMGRRLNQEAAKAVRYGGMSDEDALKLVTSNPARILHIDEYTGSIAAGKDADIVLWDDHPLSVYAKVIYTYVEGKRYFDRKEMEARRLRDQKIRNDIATKMRDRIEGGSKKQKPARKMERYYHCDTKD